MRVCKEDLMGADEAQAVLHICLVSLEEHFQKEVLPALLRNPTEKIQ